MRRTAAQIREEFIDFFTQRAGHAYVPSSPVVPHDDPTLLFTNAGMNQFKDVFLGTGSPPHQRVVNTQKCIRAGGKHNDLEDVGKDTYHHTFFEMLGNWSFGDYFKAEAIQWAWELLTHVWGLPKDRLHATYFQGDPAENLEPDLDARDLWLRYLPAERVHPGNKRDNFWEMGESGPCGPCSEMHYDSTPGLNGAALVNAGDPRVIEIWNLVFIQFNRAAGTGRLSPLPARHVDTGMGFERIVRILQGKASNYDTDLWTPIFMAIESHTGAHPYTGHLDDPVDTAYRVIADHIRCLTFAITDGARPSNEGRGYVLRRILRRAVRHAHQTLGVKGPMLWNLVPAVVESLGDAFPELAHNPQQVAQVIHDEEESFLRTLDRGIELFDEAANTATHDLVAVDNAAHEWASEQLPISSVKGPHHYDYRGVDWQKYPGSIRPRISASDAFKLHDTYGFPIDLTRVMAEERGLTVDVEGFERLMAQARQVSKQKTAQTAGPQTVGLPPEAVARLKAIDIKPTEDIDKYHGRPIIATLKAIWNGVDFDERTDDASPNQRLGLITDKTNFYAEAGGQIGDTGRISDVEDQPTEFFIEDTHAFGVAGESYVLHIGRLTRGALTVGESVNLNVHADRRSLIRANHTGTHLLNLALREVMGNQINQKGSLVADDRLRFDFSSQHGMKPEEVEAVEQVVNTAVHSSLKVYAEDVPLAKAKLIHGVRAVFGERYPDPVRVVSIGVPVSELLTDPGNSGWRQFSIEFCGGTHLDQTDQAQHFVLVSEQALAAGVRRIIGLTGPAAQAADIAGRDLEARAINAAKLADDLLPGEFDDIARLAGELTIGSVRRARIAQLLESLRARVKKLRKSVVSAARGPVVDQARALVERPPHSNGRIIVGQIDGADKDSLLAAMDVVRARRPEAAAMLLSANQIESKVFIVAAVPKSIIELGLRAGDWVKQAASACGGSGGGRADLAQAGGKEPAKVSDAVEAARNFAQQKIGAQ